jgi:hypothetical protein
LCNDPAGFQGNGLNDCSTVEEAPGLGAPDFTAGRGLSDSKPFDFADPNGDGSINTNDVSIAKAYNGRVDNSNSAGATKGYDRDVDVTRDGINNTNDLNKIKVFSGVNCTDPTQP